ncbi:MAG: hypothetical protein ACI865_002076 [Flavobacteriaceae bacterium]|jgi:hypothetical protein
MATVGTITVPAGKVWKVEHCSAWYMFPPGRRTLADRPSVYIGDIVVLAANGGGNVTNYSLMPVWLPSGTYNIYVSNEDGTAHVFTTTINAIEFNVVP